MRIVAINYANQDFKCAQRLNSKTAKKFGADEVIEYGPEDLDADFREKNKEILSRSRGAGYWIWKPYIILKTLKRLEEGDYLVYTDSGAAFINRISYLIDAMNREGTDVMCFCIKYWEYMYSKRDALILMNADREEITNSRQICGSYMILRNSVRTRTLIEDFLRFVQDVRIVTDDANVCGKENYDGFVENRHDQTVWSLLCKRNGIHPFRDPSQCGLNREDFTEEVLARSTYPQVIESHRDGQIKYYFQLDHATKWWHKLERALYQAYWALRCSFHNWRISKKDEGEGN